MKKTEIEFFWRDEIRTLGEENTYLKKTEQEFCFLMEYGNMKAARAILEQYYEQDCAKLQYLYGCLERCEYNFEASEYYFRSCYKDPRLQKKALLGLARLYTEFGRYDIAEKMIETFGTKENFGLNFLYERIIFSILRQNHQEAFHLSKKMPQKMPPFIPFDDAFLKGYLKWLRNPKKIPVSDREKDYKQYRLFEDSDDSLVWHLKKERENTPIDRCFFRYTDFHTLICDSKEKMRMINPLHVQLFDHYPVLLDDPIGFVQGELTSALNVITASNTPIILSMYPIIVSNQFDQEGIAKNRYLKLNREWRGQNGS